MARSAKRTGLESSGIKTNAPPGLVGGRQEFARFEGNAELEEALMQICGQSPERRIKGAETIMRLMSKEPIDPKLAERAFDPLLTLAESERDKEVKRSFLKALGSAPLQFTMPANTIQRIEELTLKETDANVVREAARAIFRLSNDNPTAPENVLRLNDKAKRRFGNDHIVRVAILDVMVELCK